MTHTNQAVFARLMKVSRKTVTIWKKRGYLEISDGLVDVAKSLTKLAAVGKGRPAGVTNTAIAVAGNEQNARSALLWDRAGPHREWALGMAIMIAPEQLAELLLPHLPPAVVRPIVTEWITEGRRGAAEMLREDGVDPPAGYVSWADHPWFNPILTEDEWIEREALAKAQVAGGDA